VQNYEFGFKIQNQWTYVDASVYDKEFQEIAYTPTDLGGAPIGPATTFGSTSRGGRLVGSVNPFATSDNKLLSAFKITVNGIYENAHYKDFQGCFTYIDINNNKVCGAINGNQLARLPKYQYRVTPGDTQVFSWGTLTEQVDVRVHWQTVPGRVESDTVARLLGTWPQASTQGRGELGGSAARLKPHQRDRADRG